MKITEAAECTGLSISTIRYYERLGICPLIQRGTDGKRRFCTNDIDWLLLLASLRATGMSLSDMRAFARLYASGDETIVQRKSALLEHRKSLEDKQLELDRCRSILDRKLKIYDQKLRNEA